MESIAILGLLVVSLAQNRILGENDKNRLVT
jgi:hypothetical protein